MHEQADRKAAYFWFDTEFTSLELEEARLLQVAVVPTDADLNRLAAPEEDFNCLVRLAPDVRCNAWVEENLAPLLARCRSDEALPVETVNDRLADYLDRVAGPAAEDQTARPVLAGNSVHADWFLARRFLPALLKRVHYRMLDVSSWKVFWSNELGETPFDKDDTALIRRFFPGEFSSPEAAHDAHFDVLASIAELNFYRRHQTIAWAPEASPDDRQTG